MMKRTDPLKTAREELAAAVLFLERLLGSDCLCNPREPVDGVATCSLCRIRQNLASLQALLADPTSPEELLRLGFDTLMQSCAWLTGIDQEEVASTIQIYAETIREERRVVLNFDDIDRHDFSCTCSLHNCAYKSFGVGIFLLPPDYDPEEISDEMFHDDPLDRIYAESYELASNRAYLLCKGMGWKVEAQ